MHRTLTRSLGAIALMGTLVLMPMTDAQAYDRNGDRDGRQGPYRASSYINPDTGAATANRNVDPNSNCQNPDRRDTQMVSQVGSTANNVHNDACLFGSGDSGPGFTVGGERVFDGPATFESTGVGTISACPDPDGAGPKTTTNNGKLCMQSGYQDKGALGVKDAPGDAEFHARLNSTVAGEQRVTFCYDPERNGCTDATLKEDITITWVTTDPGTGGSRWDGYSR